MMILRCIVHLLLTLNQNLLENQFYFILIQQCEIIKLLITVEQDFLLSLSGYSPSESIWNLLFLRHFPSVDFNPFFLGRSCGRQDLVSTGILSLVQSHPTVAILSLDLPCHFHSKPLQIPENNAFLPSVLSAFPILTYVWVELMPKAWRKPRSTKVHLSEKATCSILSLNRLQHQSRLEPVSALWSDVLSWATSNDHGPATCLHISRQMCNLSV